MSAYAGHAFGARHFDTWIVSKDITASELFTLAVTCLTADAELAPGGVGYFGTGPLSVALETRVGVAAATRRLDRLVEVGALIRRQTLGITRYWLPEEVA